MAYTADPTLFYGDNGVTVEEFEFQPSLQDAPVRIVRVVEHPFEVGDTVTYSTGQTTYTVTEIHDSGLTAESDESGRWYSWHREDLLKITRYNLG